MKNKKMINKIFCGSLCMICGVLCISQFSITPVFAQDATPEDIEREGQNQDPQTGHPDYFAIGGDENYEAVKNSGSKPSEISEQQMFRATYAYVTDQAWTNYGIQQYYQDDYTTPVCSGGSSMSQVGCAVTSFSMVAAKYGVYKNPEQMFYALNATGAITDNCEMTWSVSGVQSALGLTMQHWNNSPNYTEADGKQTIEGILKTGKPVIVGLKKVGSSSRHFVVCYGYEKYSDGGTYHYIFNPQRGRADTIEGYMANYFIESFTTLY